MKINKRAIAYNALILIGIMLLLCLVTRLWPVILLMIVGAVVMCVKLLFRLIDEKDKTSDILPVPITTMKKEPESESDVVRIAFGIIQKRIAESLLNDYPEARWLWEQSNPMRRIADGDEVSIRLNRAGGYKKMLVNIQNLQFLGLTPVVHQNCEEDFPLNEDTDACSDEGSLVGSVNYELMAFSWVEENMLDLAAQSNECIAHGKYEYLIPSSDLPDKESWGDICAEIKRHDFPNALVKEDGILVILPQ